MDDRDLRARRKTLAIFEGGQDDLSSDHVEASAYIGVTSDGEISMDL